MSFHKGEKVNGLKYWIWAVQYIVMKSVRGLTQPKVKESCQIHE